MGAVSTLFGLVALGLGGYRAGRSAFRLPPGSPAVLGGFVLAWTWVTLGTLGLGLAGLLARGPLLAWAAGGLAVAMLFGRPPGADRHADGSVSPGRWGLDAALAIGLALWAAIVMFMPTLLLPVKVISDGPIYHLYFAARWWQSGRIAMIPTPFGENAAPYFPANGDLWLAWLVATFGGDRLARVGQLPFFLAAVATAYALSRRLGAGPSASAVAVCWFATVTPFVLYSAEPIVDTVFAAGYLLAVYFAARYALGDDGAGSLALAGLAAGAAWGTKAPGIVFVPPLLALIVAAIAAKGGPWRSRIRDAAVLVATSLVLEIYWPLHNAWLTGNPLYPIQLSVFGRTILAGWYGPGAMRTSRYYADPSEWRVFLDILLSVLDARLAPVWLAALAGAWRIGRRGPGTREDRLVWACAGLAVLNIALYWLVIPYRTQQRFFLHAMGLATVPLARLFDRGRWVRAAGVLLVGLHVLTAQSWPVAAEGEVPPWDFSPHIPGYLPSVVPFLDDLGGLRHRTPRLGPAVATGLLLVGVGSVAAAGLMAWARGGPRWRWVAAGSAVVLVAAVQGRMIVARRTDPKELRFPTFRDYYFGWADLDLRLGKTPARIAYAGTNLPYYLMGDDFRNEVRYVNVDDHPGWLLHDYHRSAASRGQPTTWPDTRPGWDRLRPDYDAWLANLEAERIRFLVVTRADPLEGRFNPADAERFPIERVWADDHPERFVRLYSDPLFRLYGVRSTRKNPDGSTDSRARSH